MGTAYNQWTQFEDFPHFMDGVESVTQLSDDRLTWVAHIAGVRRHWDAVEFSDAGGNKTQLSLTLEYQPQGMVEKVGDLLHVVARQAEHDLKKFKEFIEHEGHATGERMTGDAPPAYNRFAHPFDQTDGLVDLGGEADGSADGDIHSRAERRADKRDDGTIPPLGGNLGDR